MTIDVQPISTIEDPLFGPVVHISERAADPDEPTNLHTYTAFGADIGPYITAEPDMFGSGCAFSSKPARAAALGEYVERYSANFIPSDLERATWNELCSKGEPAADPGALFPFSDEQEVVRTGRFRRPAPETELEWVKMTGTHTDLLVPADLVYLNYYRSRPFYQRRYPVLLPGIAAGVTFEHALRSATTEVLERDATSLWWHARLPATRVNLPEDFFAAMGRHDRVRFSSDGLLLRTYDAGTPLFVAAFVLRDLEEGTIQVGFACRASLSAALYKAAAEAWQLRRLTKAVREPDSWAWRKTDGASPLPLLATTPTAVPQLTQLVHNIQYYLDNRRARRAYEMISETVTSDVDLDSGSGPCVEAKLDLDKLQSTEGLDVYFHDVTTADMRSAGYSVVRAYSPQACPNLPAAFPPLANGRLASALALSGRPAEMEPLPHA